MTSGPTEGKRDIEALLRPNVRALEPYSSARHDYEGEARVWLDANENPFDTGANRYPDPRQAALKKKLAALKGVAPDQLFLGNGSDEAIDLLIRMFCRPGIDHVLQLPPTYGMYRVSANISDVAVREVALDEHFQPRVDAILDAVDAHSKILFLCSPNNPTGNRMADDKVRALLEGFPGMVVVDEAYIDFAEGPSLARWLPAYPHLVLLQTFSKAWGLAAARLGTALASPEVITFLNKVKPPYNVNELTQRAALQALDRKDDVRRQVQVIRQQRERLAHALPSFGFVQRVWPSEANFLLIRVDDARSLYGFLSRQGIIVRDRSRVVPHGQALRVTVGRPEENDELLQALRLFDQNRPGPR